MSLSDTEISVIKKISENSRFIFNELKESYVAFNKEQHAWTEEIKLQYFTKWCMMALNWGYKSMPISPEARAAFLEAVKAQDLKELQIKEQVYISQQTTLGQKQVEVLKGVHEFSYIGIRSLILANGGALVALLTFVATIWKENHELLSHVFKYLMFFIFGVGFAITTCFFAYINNVKQTVAGQEPYAEKYRVLAIISAWSSLGLFLLGSTLIIIWIIK